MTFKRKPVVAGNWKMNGLKEEGIELARGVVEGSSDLNCEIIVCPSFPLLHPVSEVLENDVKLGAQDCHFEPGGAYTGDVAVSMLVDANCSHVILGHSERRADHGETDDIVKAKAEAAYAAGLVAIICVGETQEQRDQGLTMATISTQLDASVPNEATAENTIIAYEPVWAIGTGLTATPEDAQDVHDHIRTYLKTSHSYEVTEAMRILYGGSMKPENASDLLAQPDIDGGLIGGAALNADSFLAIAKAASDL
ncbi:triose-phosphate isomerase [Curvivirga aplysinae]|uniref:triose-phosphate isomerase n=1 Tax=Curvivirga aplysinae TaxID=2529852 RepID=UPI0012BBC143|nr:triose-phosphate isomerase [Curvivirga aplysinae]MTI08665.1 triose-phosphate isomerase [Curvivirga aplysinae]